MPIAGDVQPYYSAGMTTPTTAADRVTHFTSKLEFETDPSDVQADEHDGAAFVLVDTRGDVTWSQGHAVGAIHMPTREIERPAPRLRYLLEPRSLSIAGTRAATERPKAPSNLRNSVTNTSSNPAFLAGRWKSSEGRCWRRDQPRCRSRRV